MEEKIQQIQNYFLNKLADADFEIMSGDPFAINVIVDGKYKFRIWIATGMEHLKISDSIGKYFMQLPDFSDDQKKFLYSKIESEIRKYTGTEHKKQQIQREIAILQNKLNNLQE